MSGVLERERQRRQFWADRDLPDPLNVLAEERLARSVYGVSGFTSPRRPALDAFFADHPDTRPPAGW